jgi:hypothetical protein
MNKQLEVVASSLSALLPGETSQSLLAAAYENCRDEGDLAEVEDRMLESLHVKCKAASQRAQGLERLKSGVSEFRGRQTVSEEVLATNRQRIREAGGLTAELKEELQMETASEAKSKEVAAQRDKDHRQSVKESRSSA